MGLRESILAAEDLRIEDVEVPEWGCTVRLREMTAAQRMAYQEAAEAAAKATPGPAAYLQGLALLVVNCARDPGNGSALFTVDDVEALKAKSLSVVQRLAEKAMSLGRAAQTAEEARGN